jgi:hypothetical protein
VDKDVIKPVGAALGFVWRRDLVGGGKTLPMAVKPILASGKVTLIVGSAQAAGATHAARIMAKANELAETGKYSHIVLNRAWRTGTGRVGTSTLRPDIIAVGRSGKVEAFEVLSPRETMQQMRRLLWQGMQSLPPQYRTLVTDANVIP